MPIPIIYKNLKILLHFIHRRHLTHVIMLIFCAAGVSKMNKLSTVIYAKGEGGMSRKNLYETVFRRLTTNRESKIFSTRYTVSIIIYNINPIRYSCDVNALRSFYVSRLGQHIGNHPSGLNQIGISKKYFIAFGMRVNFYTWVFCGGGGS